MSSHIPHFVAFWRWTKGKRLIVLAGFFTAMEFIVTSGLFKPPLADDIPQWLRALVIAAIIFLRVYLGWRAEKEGHRA